MERKFEEKKTEKFLKEAFCIDGECTFMGYEKAVGIIYPDTPRNEMKFKLNDSERGTFYVTIGR
nr:hypothetical protein [uncultured Allomuricauda sp.]